MLNLTPTFDELLKRNGGSTARKSYSLEQIDEFLKEAYRINSHITTLYNQLSDVRQAYLSTAQPRRSRRQADHHHSEPLYLTDQQREEIDANAKRLLRDLNASIRGLSDAEDLNQETQRALLKKKYGGALAGLGSWGITAVTGKSREQTDAEEALRQVAAHREGVLWYLRQRLQECGRAQQSMMEARLTRMMEKNRDTLAKARLDAKLDVFPETAGGVGAGAVAAAATAAEPRGTVSGLPAGGSGGGRSSELSTSVQLEEEAERRMEGDLTQEQLQMFEKGNQDMLKYYEETLDKVRTAEKSLIEISELQTLLVNNLEVQSAHVDQLIADSFNTTDNVEKGNKELKKALNRPSTARYTFYAASGLCLFMVVWDFFV